MATPRNQTLKPLSISKRVCLSFAWTVFGLVFFYLVMVALSSIAKGIVLDRLLQHGWARTASRHTGAVTAPVFSLFLITSPSSLWSLFMAVMVACAHFCHFVIIASDVRVYNDDEIIVKMFRTESTHPVFRLLPLNTAHVLGTIGLVAMLLVSSERCYGPALGKRQNRLPTITRLSCAWIWAVFNLFFLDRLVRAILDRTAIHEDDIYKVVYPLSFVLVLAIAAAVCLRRELLADQKERLKVDAEKKTE